MMYTNLFNNRYENCFIKNKKQQNIDVRYYTDSVRPASILDLISLHEYHKFTLVKFYIKVGYPLTSQPNINAIIGPYGVNIMNLQKKIEPIVQIFEKDTILPIVLKIFDFDKYHLIVKSPTLSFFINQIANSSTVDSNFISIYQIYELVNKKKKDLNNVNLSDKAIFFSVAGYLKSSNRSIYL